ncbi:MAG: beta-xylosidase, partial [Opitutaceae bacterium]|nr:beta-xylosidase [Opitutaceae bacterium]
NEKRQPVIRAFALDSVQRDFGLCRDTWRAGDLAFTIYTQLVSIPDPAAAANADTAALRDALVPAVWAELTIDNRAGRKPRRGFFGYAGKDPYSMMRTWVADDFVAAGQGGHVGIFARSEPGVQPGQGFSAAHILTAQHPRNVRFGLGGTAGIIVEAAPGELRTFAFAIAFFRGGIVTTGVPARYYYTKFFNDIDAVGRHALARLPAVVAASAKPAGWDAFSRLSADRRFMFAHALRSYYGSTEFLVAESGEPLWVVNEGEYRMMNTFDLTVDHLFFELRQNPWVVRNQLDWFRQRYSYTDEVVDPVTKKRFPGGLSFTHDMGIANAMTPAGYSSYELFGLDGCFSHMTHEQLVNFIHCAALYIHHSGDTAWADTIPAVLASCQDSLLVRDNPDPALRNGVMGFDSSRCDGGAEITTYDSLDTSLGQARNNLYIAVKTWAAYLALESFWQTHGDPTRAAEAAAQARRAADSIVSAGVGRDALPAVLFENVDSAIIPAVEGLVFPWALGLHSALSENGPYGALIATLKRHTTHVLAPAHKLCRFEDGGWKISSTSNNSWLSKVYLCQFVVSDILGLADAADEAVADAAHRAWLLHPENTYFAWSDQMVSGIAKGSKYYPRGVTAVLWLT